MKVAGVKVVGRSGCAVKVESREDFAEGERN